jgi:hypothetical protein
MPLSKLENFIKNTEGRILYVNPSDIDSTDSLDNQGNSLTKPFKTIQRALLESARFSYVRGKDNDIIDKTTILLFPGEHLIDNRPGYGIKNNLGAKAVSPSGAESVAATEFGLTLNSNFDLSQEDNDLYKFNSVNGGVILPRGTSLVGLDLRKTKIRPKYVPNPTDPATPESAIFRITGLCYIWQFTIFDADPNGTVYTNHQNFTNQLYVSRPLFSHHKLTAFEFADGVNKASGYDYTDLSMYYYKLTHAFGPNTNRPIAFQWPDQEGDFDKQRAEWEIVGALAADPIAISNIISGDGTTPTTTVTVDTDVPHLLDIGTPIRITGVNVANYNVSTTVTNIVTDTKFTYTLSVIPVNLDPTPSTSSPKVTVESDTVSGASPYIFNISLRSVYGMNGAHGDGSKADGFRSMVTAQYTAISLQKDDRAFVKYNKNAGTYDGINISTPSYGADLPAGSASTNSEQVYHLDSRAVYRRGWETTHMKYTNDGVCQVVSVFAIGFARHFQVSSGGDQSITNSNSNFGQISLYADGFKKESFAKDDQLYMTALIPPRAIPSSNETKITFVTIDVGLTTAVGVSSHLYLKDFNEETGTPPAGAQGFKIGARDYDKIYVNLSNTGIGETFSASIQMLDNTVSASSTIAAGENTGFKEFKIVGTVGGPNDETTFNTLGNHTFITGESVILIQEKGNIPDGLEDHRLYYVIRTSTNTVKLASNLTNALNGRGLNCNNVKIDGTLKIISRVSDKLPGEAGHPVQWDPNQSNWFIKVNRENDLYKELLSRGVDGIADQTSETWFNRVQEGRSLDERIYTGRLFIPKEAPDARDPSDGFVIQESRSTSDILFDPVEINEEQYAYNRNPRFIATCSYDSGTAVVTLFSERPHTLQVGHIINVKGVKSTNNVNAIDNQGYNGRFTVTSITDSHTAKYALTTGDPGTFTNDTSVRDSKLPRFEKNQIKSNFYIFRPNLLEEFSQGFNNGISQADFVSASYPLDIEFTDRSYPQPVEDFYPQLDRDNWDDNPLPSQTYAKRTPIGLTVLNDKKKSLTREAVDNFLKDIGIGATIVSIATSEASGIATITTPRFHEFGKLQLVSNISNAGSGFVDGVYYNKKLFNEGTTDWDGALAKIVVTGGSVVECTITAGGAGYVGGEILEIEHFSGAQVTTASNEISYGIGDVLQFTGLSTASDCFYRVVKIPSSTTVAVAVTAGDQLLVPEQFYMNTGPAVSVSSVVWNAKVGIATFTTSGLAGGHGLVQGNAFRVVDSSNNKISSASTLTVAQPKYFNFLVENVINTTTFTAKTTNSLVTGANFIYKGGMTANAGAILGSADEKIGGRGFPIYDNEIGSLKEAIGDTDADNLIRVGIFTDTSGSVGVGSTARYKIGEYVQVNNEIMRISRNDLAGINNDALTVLRGYFGTEKKSHPIDSRVKKIKAIPIELRRNSILRASGHTFEYLGYGPGNYSTGLPQVQNITLSARETFLAQAQELSGGVVVYTGMNNDGDFFIGNKSVSSATGRETSYDTPIASVTGEEGTSVVGDFDEVTITQRLKVEGGASKTILSQFDGPVTFQSEVKINDDVLIDGDKFIIDADTSLAGNLDITGDVIATGIGSFGGDVTIGGNVDIDGSLTVSALNTNTKADGDTVELGSVAFVDTSSGAVALTIPDPGTVAKSFRIIDISGNAATNNITLTFQTVSPNPTRQVMGYTETQFIINQDHAAIGFVFNPNDNYWYPSEF